ncbi:hypothetical protein AB1Y20_010579 [Prymnesium parvum]|uniref:Uncharacterized protein n=1 Tax=Prymnesium parvum TaxID=97485 RepID=A0AB34IPX7_PRYPA
MIDALGRPMAPFGHHPFAFRTAFGRPAHTFESRSLIDTGPPPAPQPRSRRSPPVLHTSMRTPRSRTDAENKCNKPNVLARPSVTKSPRAVDAWMPSPTSAPRAVDAWMTSPTSAAEHARSLLKPRKLPVPVYAPSSEIGTLRALHAGRPMPESGSRPSTARSACSAPAHASGGVSRHTASSTRRQALQAAHITPSGIEARFRPKPPPPRPSSSPVFRRPMLRTAVVEERVVVERSASVVTENPQPPVRSEPVEAHVHVLVESTRIGEFPVAQVKIFFSPEEVVANVVQAFWRSCITRKSCKADDRQKRAEMAAAKIARLWQQRVQEKRQQFDRRAARSLVVSILPDPVS